MHLALFYFLHLFAFTVLASDLLQLFDLETLEIRGSDLNRNLIFQIDEPMPKLKHVNFEAVLLYADETIAQHHPKGQHPSEVYDYVPESQRNAYSHDVESGGDASSQPVEFMRDVEIVPYNVYVMELEKFKRATFVGWANLEVLRIHDSNLNRIYWEMFDGLDNLRHMSLEHNGIRVIPPFAFYGARHTRTLSLARNQIDDMHYLALAGLLELEHLDLSSNNMSALSEFTFPPFPNLRTANLRENPIESILPMTFGVMNATLDLTLGSSHMAFDLKIANGAFLALDQLVDLTLLNVSSGSLAQSVFNGLKQLRRMKLIGDIGRIEYDAFAEMPNLKELLMSECGIVDISMDAFYGIKNLRILDLSYNRLTQIPAGLFDEQKELEEIYLHNNQLKKLPANFFDVSTLKLVRLVGNPWICSCTMTNWKQSITNSIRLLKLTQQTSDEHCIRNGKTGKIEHCDEEFDDFPRYSYGFDNSLSPLCRAGWNGQQARDVYYALRHTVKCMVNQPLDDKQRYKNKLLHTLDKLSRTNKNEGKVSKRLAKTRRMHTRSYQIQRTMSNNAEILNEHKISNEIFY